MNNVAFSSGGCWNDSVTIDVDVSQAEEGNAEEGKSLMMQMLCSTWLE